MALVPVQGALVSPAHTAHVFALVNDRFSGELRITAPDGASRSKVRQAWLQLMHRLYPKKYAFAASPETSNHVDRGQQFGALDISNWARFPALRTVMAAHGFVRDPSEPWHYNDTGSYIIPAATNTTPIEAEEEDDMNKVELIFDGAAWYATVVGAPKCYHLSPEEFHAYRDYNAGKRQGDNPWVNAIERVHAALAPAK